MNQELCASDKKKAGKNQKPEASGQQQAARL